MQLRYRYPISLMNGYRQIVQLACKRTYVCVKLLWKMAGSMIEMPMSHPSDYITFLTENANVPFHIRHMNISSSVLC